MWFIRSYVVNLWHNLILSGLLLGKNSFWENLPGEEFLPKAPNPEDIIFDDGEGSPPRESGFEPIPEASIETEGAETVTAETAQCSDATGPNSAGVASKSSGKGEVGVTSGHVDATSGDGDTCVATGDGAQSDCSGVASASP